MRLYPLLEVRNVPTGYCGWTGHVELILKRGAVVVYNAYLRRFSPMLVGSLRGVIINHYQQTGRK